MKKYVLLSIIICINASLSIAQKISREEKIKAVEMLSDFFGRPTPSKTPVPDVISEKGLPANLNTADFDKKLALFTNSFYFQQSSFRDNEARIEADVFHLPNMDLVNGQFLWNKATTKEGGTLEIVPRPDQNRMSSMDFFNEVVTYKPQNGKTLNTIEGTFSFTYPTEFKQITLTKADIGKEKDLDGEMVKLLSIENDIAVFEIKRKTEDSRLNYYALNAKGEPLQLEVIRSEVPKSIYSILDKDGKIPEARKKELVDKFDDLRKEPIISYVKALGTIAQLVIVQPKGTSSKKIPIVVHRTPDFQHGETTLSHERYENLPTIKYDKIAEADLANLTIKADRTNDGLNNHKIILSMPNSFNSAFAKVEFKDVVATDAGKNSPYTPQGAFYDNKPKTFSFRLDPPGGDQPIDADLIKGKVEITYPVEITTEILPVNAPSDKFEMKNPLTVTYFTNDDDLDNSGEFKPKRAYAANGMQLKRVEGFYTGGSKDGKNYMEYVYWGKPATIQIDKATKWVTKEIPFSLKPAPKRPKEF
ncbi:hypothetical protein [Emticicia sp. C21]|uniref:hypothetical protein n=1 Tax=Emticicia sp. C21 TaxID=2302915 RepID=UPI000E357AE1|nr:hypothetical protein [Emticicia sp. C21]RFS18439.1 hypothetical protein D0T08_04090 [Emticicia sp. C21]